MQSLEDRLSKLEKKMSEIEKKIDLLLNMMMSEFYEDEEFVEAPEIDKRILT